MRNCYQATPPLGFAIVKNVVSALLLVSLVNLLIFSGFGFSNAGIKGGHVIGPIPGWIIGVVWTGLFAGLGMARGVAEADGSSAGHRASRSVLILAAACAAYPFYTLGLRNDIIGLASNVATICLSVWVAARIGPVSRIALMAPLAVAGWIIFASAAMIDGG